MPRSLKTQFIIADAAHARWVCRSGHAHDFVTTKEVHAEAKAKPTPSGVAFESSASQRFNIEPRDEAVRAHKNRFAHEIADAINAEAANGHFDRLAVVAPARVLQAISERLNTAASAKLAKTLAKDLTKTPDHELGTWLRGLEL
jgi:protein required for attachment to host cells